MIKIKFANGWEEVFKNSGLKSFKDFFSYSAGKLINENKKRDVVLMTIGEGERRKELFMKRFYDPHFKDMLFTLGNFGRICSQAQFEWNNANLLLQNGIDTYKPICCGWESVCGLEKRSFFITEKIYGICLADFVTQNWANLNQDQKENIFAGIGTFVLKIHDAKISFADLYIWHIFITESAGQYSFAVIDLHRMKINTTSRRQQIRNLGAFDFSLSEKYFDDQIRNVFFNAYFAESRPGRKKDFLRKVKNRSKQLANRRRRQSY